MMIPSDIITQILYGLPSKSIGRFRCVSKCWLFLLTQSEFIKTHRETLNRNNHIFVNADTSTNCFVLYSHPFHDHDPYILNPTKLPIELADHAGITFRGSCYGLVLVSQRIYTYDTLVLINPTTRESLKLQKFGYYPPMKLGACLHITHGVGYDSVTDDYKVITLNYYFEYTYDGYRNLVTNTYVYSLKSNTWRQLIIDSLYDCRYSPDAVYVNGFLHWRGRKKDTHHSRVIVAFSLVDECFSEVPLPDLSNDIIIMFKHCKPVVLGGKLAIYVYSEFHRANLEVWLMNEYGVKESWTKIPLDMFDNDDFPVVDYRIFDDNGKIRVANNGQMWIYDFEKRTFSKNIYVWSSRFGLFGSYVESLLSLKRKDTTDAEQIIDISAERQNVGSKASEVALPKNLNPIYHPFCNKFAKILNDKKASLRKKREEGREKVKNRRKKVKNSKKINLGSGGSRPHQL